MGFFSFLTPDQQEQPNPEGWKVRRKGKDYWEVNPDTPAGPEDEVTREDQTPIASGEELKPYSQRRGETSSKVFASADKIINRYGGLHPDLAAKARRDVRANPDNAAKTVEKYLTEVVKRGNDAAGVPMGDPDIKPLYDKDFSALEDSVRGLRSMKRGTEEQALAGQLATTDLKKNLAELQNLRGQLDVLTKDIASQNVPEAVSARGEEENKKLIGEKQQQAAAIAEHIKQLEAVTNQQTTVNAPPKAESQYAPGVGATLPASQTPIQDYLRGFGLERKDLIPRVHAALTVSGISPEKWGDDVDPRSGVLRIMAQLDKDGTLAGAIARQLQEARQQDANSQQNAPQQQPTDPRIAQTEARIGQREAELRALYASLKDNEFMRTWPGIILYVLVGLITQNPAFAARLIGGRDNRAAIGAEIKGIQGELARLDRQLARDIDRDVMVKREAARRLQHKEDRDDQRKWEVSKLMLQHNLIIERNAKKGNPETFMMKKLAAEFQRSLGMASKFSGEMQNEFADPGNRAKARQNFEHYMRKAAQLDEDIKNMGGAVLTEEPDTEE